MDSTSVAKVTSPNSRVPAAATKPAPNKTKRIKSSGKKTPPTKVSAVKKRAPLKKRATSVQERARDESVTTSVESAIEPEISVPPAERALSPSLVPKEPLINPTVTATADDEPSLAADDSLLAMAPRSQKKRRRGIRLKKGLHDE